MSKLKKKNNDIEEEEKVKKNPEQTLATGGGFLFVGIYLLSTGAIPESFLGWLKFIGMFVLVSLVLYGLIYSGRRLYERRKYR